MQASRTVHTYPMHVILKGLRQVHVHDVTYPLDIESSACDICRHKHLDGAQAEAPEGLLAIALCRKQVSARNETRQEIARTSLDSLQ